MRRRGVLRELTPFQRMELLIGPSRTSYFESDDERAEAWELHGKDSATWGNYRPGTRPWAWWEFSSPEPRGFEAWDELKEAQELKRMGELSEQEIRDFGARYETSIDAEAFAVRDSLRKP